MTTALKEGDPITSGPLLRFIPNWDKITWEYDKDRPSPRAWRERPGEDYVSIFLEGEDAAFTSVEALKKLKPDFAIYRVTAETLIGLGNVTLQYKPVAEPEGHAHVGIFGINRSRAEKLARGLVPTERVKDPGPAAAPPSSDRTDDTPRDFWQGSPR